MANPALIDELEKQFRDNPRRVFARLANEYRKSGDYMRAIEICHAHVPQQPGYISGHIVLGQALYDAGELDQAKETFQAALSLDPENLIALRQLGDISRTRRDFRDARGWYTRLLEVDPQNEEIVAQLGELALAEDSRGARDTDSAAESAEQLEEADGGVAVDTDDAPKLEAAGEDDDLVSPEARAIVSMESDEPEPDAEGSFEFSGNGASSPAPDLLTLDESGDDEAETAFAPPEGLTIEDHGPALMPPDADDDEVAWVAAEGHASPAMPTEDATPDEQDGTEFVIAAEASDDDREPDAQDSDDFDFMFEPEEYEAPLRPHTGESLSVVAEEDALAGVHTGEWEERSPFGEPIGEPEHRQDEDTSSSFEPLPLSELDAAAGELPEMEALLIDAESDAVAPPVEQPQSSFRAGDDEGERADVFDLSDAETLIEEESDAFAWGDTPTPASSEVVSEPAPTPPHSDDDTLLDWEATTEPETHSPAPELSAPAGHEPEPDDSPASEFFVSAVASDPDASDEHTTVEAEADPAAAAEFGQEAAEQPDEHLTTAEADRQDADLDDAAVEPVGEAKADAAASAFVTETMAELYLQQGFRAEALDVFRRLAAQSPDDEALRERIAGLEREAAPPSSPVSPNAVTPEHAPQQRTAAAFFRALASMPAPAVHAPAPPQPVTDFSGWIEDALSDAGEVSDEDDAAAAALASGFAADGRLAEARGGATRAAERDMSLNDVFGAEPPSGRAHRAGSLDAFLTPEGENASAPTGDEEGREDLEAFNAWLEGLKK